MDLKSDSRFYVGSRRLASVAAYFGLSTDKFNFLFCQLMFLVISYPYRILLHPSKVSPTIRHLVALGIGLSFGYFCFGYQILHLLVQATIIYGIILFSSPDHMHKKVPTALEYYGYVMHYHTLMCGPLVFFNDYQDFIKGKQYLRHSIRTGMRGTPREIIEPSSNRAVAAKVLTTFLSAASIIYLLPQFPIEYIKGMAFFFEKGWLWQMLYIIWATSLHRHRYYHAWTLGEAICNAAGFGFNGYTSDGKARWNLLTNVDILTIEVRRSVRPMFQHSNTARQLYDVLTCLATRMAIGYMVFPFLLLDFYACIRVYKNFWFLGHILALLAMVLLPRVLPPARRASIVRAEQQAEEEEDGRELFGQSGEMDHAGHMDEFVPVNEATVADGVATTAETATSYGRSTTDRETGEAAITAKPANADGPTTADVSVIAGATKDNLRGEDKKNV
ncbi:membrane bound O-acyltransferase domain-containing protein, putative [Ixodes scapularis]|uniref:Membrane bound O-acyltransferase domain-containing protein, putative n=1 Tax=Ixodes scapularis TaxID=6945 RepID=B7PIF5_IXOSC|nr:membrane bound O-acyltransferase domain-containing protein, putative [Ixodes scapularis]|eukprot:XP_002404928.1 membrane bound O-acyltransferase domain-containing protein, putative [Ixodes scapularis]